MGSRRTKILGLAACGSVLPELGHGLREDHVEDALKRLRNDHENLKAFVMQNNFRKAGEVEEHGFLQTRDMAETSAKSKTFNIDDTGVRGLADVLTNFIGKQTAKDEEYENLPRFRCELSHGAHPKGTESVRDVEKKAEATIRSILTEAINKNSAEVTEDHVKTDHIAQLMKVYETNENDEQGNKREKFPTIMMACYLLDSNNKMQDDEPVVAIVDDYEKINGGPKSKNVLKVTFDNYESAPRSCLDPNLDQEHDHKDWNIDDDLLCLDD